MEILKVILMAVALVSVAMFGLAIRILLKKGGQFPNTHVSGNKYLKEQGISCVRSYDRMEQNKARKEVDLTALKVAQK